MPNDEDIRFFRTELCGRNGIEGNFGEIENRVGWEIRRQKRE
jgi:hypothetical protein